MILRPEIPLITAGRTLDFSQILQITCFLRDLMWSFNTSSLTFTFTASSTDLSLDSCSPSCSYCNSLFTQTDIQWDSCPKCSFFLFKLILFLKNLCSWASHHVTNTAVINHSLKCVGIISPSGACVARFAFIVEELGT